MSRTKATAIEAIKAYPWVLLYRWAYKSMGRSYPWHRSRIRLSLNIRYDDMTLSNKLMLVGAKKSNPWFSRYPRWATNLGMSCGCDTLDGGKCEISGLGHPGPHRLNPNGTPWEQPKATTIREQLR